jgi:hypothetical protein
MTGAQTPAISDKFFDQLETRQPEAREQALLNMLPGLIQRATEVAPVGQRILRDTRPPLSHPAPNWRSCR